MNRSRILSSALVSATISLALLLSNFCFVSDRERIDFLLGKIPPDSWCPRFERFLCSSAKPKILILSSSVGFVPSLMCDIKNGDVSRPTSFIELERLSTHYESPSFLLAAMRAQGIENVSAVHMGIPTANISDILLLLQKSLAYGKKPKVLLLLINIRDFLVPSNWPAIDRLDEPIKNTLGDIPTLPGCLPATRFVRDLFVYVRPGYCARIFDDARFYFAYEVYNFVRPIPFLKSFLGQSDILRNRMVRDVERDNHFDAVIAGIPNAEKLDVREQNDILAFKNSKFENAQFEAFEQIIALSKAQGIKIVIAEVPLYPGVRAPGAMEDRYSKAFANALSQNVLFIDDGAGSTQFPPSDYPDVMHLNGIGGEQLLTRIADFFAQHRSELFN